MAINSLEGQDVPSPSVYYGESDTIDLRQYIETIFLWWREIVMVVAIALVLGIIIGLVRRATVLNVYETSADVVMARVVSSVNLVDTFRTTTDDTAVDGVTMSSRREALVNLVKSGNIAEEVIAELDGILSEEEHDPAVLLSTVEAEAPLSENGRISSDLIRITVTADDPVKAQEIANSWARHYVAHVNSVYNQVPNEIFASVEEELAKAKDEYESARLALEEFIATNRIDELQRQIEQKKALRSNYEAAETGLISSVIEQDRATRTKLFNDLVSTQTDALYQVFSQQAQALSGRLTKLYQMRDEAQRQLTLARNLERQISTGASRPTAGTLLALQLLKTQVFAAMGDSDLPGQITIDLGTSLTADDADPAADVTALIDTLDQYITQINSEIDSLSEELLAGEGYDYVDRYTPERLMISTPTTSQTISSETQSDLTNAIYARYFDLFRVGELARLGESGSGSTSELSQIISQLITETNALQAALSEEQSKQLVLTQQRDQAWNTYNTLSNKVVELRLARTAANTEVRFGSAAVAPANPVRGIGLPVIIVAAGFLGLIIAFALVTIAHVMSWQPWFRQRLLREART